MKIIKMELNLTDILKKDRFRNQNKMGVKPFYSLKGLKTLVTGASCEAAYITGDLLNINGGMYV